jgi:hypothetical protein
MNAGDQTRLASVDAVRAHQRRWLDETRTAVAEHNADFAICNADDFEEVFTAFDIPVLVVNYWNSIITFSERKGPHFSAVLRERGYTPNMFAMGLAGTLEPEQAPWGGLPRPTMIVGTTRDEAQLRVTELWARAFGCDCYPLDFSWTSQYRRLPPRGWWDLHFDRSDEMIDPARHAERVDQMRKLISYLEQRLGRPFAPSRFREIMEGVNEQMALWREAFDLIASARPLPVSLRDQTAVYQLNWQRGTATNIQLMRDFLAEVRALVTAGAACYPQERFRLYLATSGNDPLFHRYLRERWGGAVVSSRYSSIAPMYARDLSHQEPLEALAARQLFLFDKEPHWEVHEAKRWGAQGVIGMEREVGEASRYRRVVEEAGLAYLALPRDADDEEVRAIIDAFVQSCMVPAQ